MFIITPEETYPYLFREFLNKRLHDGLKAELMKTAEATVDQTVAAVLADTDSLVTMFKEVTTDRIFLDLTVRTKHEKL
jgi:hypothetical protein